MLNLKESKDAKNKLLLFVTALAAGYWIDGVSSALQMFVRKKVKAPFSLVCTCNSLTFRTIFTELSAASFKRQLFQLLFEMFETLQVYQVTN